MKATGTHIYHDNDRDHVSRNTHSCALKPIIYVNLRKKVNILQLLQSLPQRNPNIKLMSDIYKNWTVT